MLLFYGYEYDKKVEFNEKEFHVVELYYDDWMIVWCDSKKDGDVMIIIRKNGFRWMCSVVDDLDVD